MSENWNPGGASYDPQSTGTPTWQPPTSSAPSSVAVVSPRWPMAITSIILFWPLGIAACVFAAKVKPALLLGDMAAALHASGRVKLFFWISVAIFVLWFLIIIVAAASTSGTGTGGY
jgi:hypothetical protein